MRAKQLAVGFAATLVSIAAQAGPKFLIDPSASWVDALVPEWTSQPSSPSQVVFGPAPPPSPPTFDWTLTWKQQRFGLSGSFALDEEISPFVAGTSHLRFSDIAIRTDAPAYASFHMPAFVTGIGQALEWWSSPGWSDPFFGVSFICACLSTGGGSVYGGSFDGTTLNLTGSQFTGIPPAGGVVLGTASQPQLNDALLLEGRGNFSFSLRATPAAVSEPPTIALLVMAVAGLAALRRRDKTRHSS